MVQALTKGDLRGFYNMTIYTRPQEIVFADSAKAGEVVAFPDIARGWGITFDQTDGEPPMEWFNSLTKQQFESIRYLMQRGVSEWSATEDYPLSALVQFEELFYISLQANKGKNPKTSLENWISFDTKYVLKSDLDSLQRAGELVLSFNISKPELTLPCYGGLVLIADYPRLFTVIGTMFGGDGVTTFGLPNYPDGYAVLAASSAATLGQKTIGLVGSHSHNLVINNAGNHFHTMGYVNYGYEGNKDRMNILNGDSLQKATSWSGDHSHTGTAANTGGAFNAAAGIKTMVYITY